MSSSQQINATSAQVQATTGGTSVPMVATLPAVSTPVLPLGLSSVPTPSMVSPFTTPVPSAGSRVSFPPSMTQFMNDPANLQAIQGFGQVMAMCQQNGGMHFIPGMFSFALPGTGTMPLQAPMAVTPFQTPIPQPSPFQPQLVSAVAPINLAGALNAAGPLRPPQGMNPLVTPDGHCVSVESGDDEWDIPRTHKKKKGKTIRPATSRNSAFERLGDREEGQRKSAKLRLGQSVAHVSAFARLGEMREAEPARTQRSRSNRQEPARTRASRQEEEAESQPRVPVANRLTIPNDRVQQMEAKLERLEKKVGEKSDRDKPLAGSPFTARDHLTPFPRKVKIDAPRFTGKEDPEIHLDSFNQSATMNGCTDEEKCLLFFQTLRNRATEWFNKLRPGSIDSFSDLASKFKAKFQENCTKRKKFTYLSTAGQRESENLTQFLTRWKEEVDKVEEMDDKTVLSLLLSGLRAGELYKEFCRKPPATYQEAYHTAWEFAEAETQLRAKKEAEHGYKPKPVQVKKEEAPVTSRPRHHYDPVIRMVNTEECQEEKSHQWVRPSIPENDRDDDRRRNNRPKERQPAPEKEHIGMIFGGPEGGDSAVQRKNWVRSIYVGEVSTEPARCKYPRREPIVFTDRDLPPTGEDHNDPLVITMDINGVDVARVLVDTGSSVNILYLETFQKLRLCRTQLEPLKTPLSGFTGDTVEAEGSIVLPVELGSGEKTVWKKMRFIVVDIKCVHNAILGRPGINKVGAVISMPHLCMRFHTPGGVGERIILLGYYWPTIVQDCERYVQKCRTCQVFYKYPGRPATYYHPVSNVIPFARFGVDIIGAFPIAQGRKKFVIVAIDYFTKWIEAEALANITTQQCKKFIWKNIITRFGAPMNLITENGPQFRNPRFTEYLEGFGIKHNRSSVAYPQGNGQVENANRTIVDGLKKRLGEAGNKWLEELPHIIWAFRVTPRRAHGETPFSLTYGCEARLPIEAEFPTFRESNYQPQQNEEDHLAELNLVEERRMAAEVKMSTYQQVVKKYHDNKVGSRYFQVGDEVLRRREASRPGDGGKLAKNWEGPYRVRVIIRPGTYRLETLDGVLVERTWNSHHLRKFYK
ncbi:unnamed protein product [Cuscuta campestris]|uniref:Integrase catalytic domain-containing protein n=1 Tax=Cuscuta campestris TaxID=132261 RepID=A0A484K4H2_9ASTE|nr:unnamed protein product [Cuscuta campestris]